MSKTKYILGAFADPDEMLLGIDKLQEHNIAIYDVFTPMPIHGIEAKLGIKPSRLPKAAFWFGLTGTCTAFAMIYYMLAIFEIIIRLIRVIRNGVIHITSKFPACTSIIRASSKRNY